MSALFHGGGISLSWKMLHQNVLQVFRPDLGEMNDFMKLFFSEELFESLFFQDDIYEEHLFSAFYHGEPEARPVFDKMGELVSGERKAKGGVYTYDQHKRLEEFRKKWEELLPFTMPTAGVPNMKEEEDRLELSRMIEDLMDGIPKAMTEVHGPLTLLMDQQKYSMVLAILSVMASALPWFEDSNSPLYAMVLPRLDAGEGCFLRLYRSRTRITWEMLHDQVFRRLNPDAQLADMKYFMPAILPQELLQILCCTRDGKLQDKYIGYVYLAKNGEQKRFTRARDHIIGLRSAAGEPYTWRDSPVVTCFRKNWEDLIPQTKYTASECGQMDDGAVRDMQAVVDSLLGALSYEGGLSVACRLQAIVGHEPYSMALAILSVIASTLFCFSIGDAELCEKDRTLISMMLPPLPGRERSAALQKARRMYEDPGVSLAVLDATLKNVVRDPMEMGEGYYLLYEKALQTGETVKAELYLRNSANAGYQPGLQKFNENNAMKYLSIAREIFEGPDNNNIASIRVCCEECEKVLRTPTYIPKECRADASYILYTYIANDRYHPATGETAEDYLEISRLNGHVDAAEIWKTRNISTITPYAARSESQTKGVCFCNEHNRFSAAFGKTIPASWGDALEPFDLTGLNKDISNPIRRRFLLFSDDFAKNLEDLFQTLQLIKDRSPKPEDLHWEFFVRHDSESIQALVDTAVSRLEGYQLPIYILNDNKMAAQQLLSQHPLFYPVRALNLEKTAASGDQRPLLHFVIIGNSGVTEWMVREAFWMMGFRSNAIRSRITVLAETGREFEIQLKGRFPGMSREVTRIDGIELPEIKGEYVQMDSIELQNKIRQFTQETAYCYFAVATDSDEGNLTLATRVREALICAGIESQKEEYLNQMPPVAFLCRSDQMAWLSKTMIIEKERFGHRWFNTRALIPFGEISNRYSFDHITGGAFDLLAKCIHYQYSQIPPSAVLAGEEQAWSAEKAYLRQYNQESSYSMALGMPYRLFQFQDYYGVQITPTGWNILESSSYASVSRLHSLANRMKPPAQTDTWEIAEWEHARWVRWMLSRGWKAATAEQAVFAYNCGNPRQQLFACKMHPCICSYEEQKELAVTLLEKCGLERNFYVYDYENVQATKQLLDLEWIAPDVKEAAR